jgi:hypothetical protein
MNLFLLAIVRVSFIVLLEQEFTVIHDAHDRRFCGRRYLDEIELSSGRHLQGVVAGHHPGLRPIGRDHTQLRRVDLFITPHPLYCTSDSSTLQYLAPSAFELDTESFGELLRDHRAQIPAAARAH